jgi:hypothetical protein
MKWKRCKKQSGSSSKGIKTSAGSNELNDFDDGEDDASFENSEDDGDNHEADETHGFLSD